MTCPVLIEPACVLANQASNAAVGGVMSDVAAAIQSGIAWVVSSTADWWVTVRSPNLAAEPAVTHIQALILPVSAAVATLAMVVAGAKMALTRKANPLVDAGAGLAVIAATSVIGVLLPSLLVRAGDAWSAWVLNAATDGQFSARLNATLQLTQAGPGVVIVLGIAAIVISVIQGVLMMFRQAALVVLAGVLPLAAAGTLLPATKAWFRRVSGWMLALIVYKPAAAAVYAASFTMIGHGGDSRTVVMGFAMLLLSLAALPALMRLFTWAGGAVESSAPGGGFLSAALGGAVAVGALRGWPGGSGALPAAQHARHLSADLGPAGGTQHGSAPRGAAGGGAPPAPSRPAGAAPGGWPTGGGAAAASADRLAGSRAAAGAGPAGNGPGTAPGARPAGGAGGGPGAAATGAAAGAAAASRRAAGAMQPPGPQPDGGARR